MGIKIPYNKLELICALNSMDPNQFTLEKLKELSQKCGLDPTPSTAEIHKKIAEDNGISVEALINGPNLKILCQEYLEKTILRFMELFKKEFGLSDLQTWAVYYYCFKE
ncbi:MAG: hypothetical protein UT05_C0012G0011 [Parcubacteria group bacterium GW2011_GWF2_38_76]|nr:MAG: hypothetical protein UT05_C0012G0011 [Parcubacteria group bacterium GW2011_GWF2_38_76]HBM46061.1 hypothetical protein [Patescibacteria group bacterium]